MQYRKDQRTSTHRWLGILPCLLISALGAADTETSPPDLNAIRAAHSTIRSLSMTVESRDVKTDELRRMKRNAGLVLELSRVRVFFDAPDRMRLEGKRGIVPLTMIVNGNSTLIRYGLIRKRDDVTGQPDKKPGGLDFGLLSTQVWTDFRITSEGHRPWENRTALVLRLSPRAFPEGRFHLVWVDEDSHRVLQVEDRTGSGELKRRHIFRQPFRTPGGGWISRRIELFNSFEKFVGALEFSDVVVNEGLQAKLFEN